MAADFFRVQATTRQNTAPGSTAEGSLSEGRSNRFGELYVRAIEGNRQHALADEGSYFVATNPTPGTAIAGISAADGYDDAEALLFIRNDATAAEGTRLYLDYILLSATAAGTNGTNFSYAMDCPTGATSYASGGSTITPVNVNRASSLTASVTMKFGAVVTTTGTTERIVSHGPLRSVIKLIGDKYLFTFGVGEKKDGCAATTAGTAIVNIVRACPPVVLGPSDQFCLREFAASQTVAAQYEFEMGFWMR